MSPARRMLGKLLAAQLNSSRQWISLGVATAAMVAYLTLWQEGAPQELDEWIENEIGSEQPDAHIDTLTTRQFGENGALQYQIFSPTAVHYPKSDTTHLETPVFDYTDEKSRWRSTALEGTMNNTNNNVLLSKQVVLQQLTKKAKLSTETLLISIDNKAAITKDPVILESNGGTMKGIGLVADFNKQTLKLVSNVEGVYGKQPR
jgi:LPS export ABC transporter protein LptC